MTKIIWNHIIKSLITGVITFPLIYLIALKLNGREYLPSFLSDYVKYNINVILASIIITVTLIFIISLMQINKMSKELMRYIEAEKSMLWISNHDPITALPNQKVLDLLISRTKYLNSANNYAVFTIEINRLRDVNDLLGYDYSNEILKLVAQRLTYLFPDNVYNLQGNDFLILKMNKDKSDLLSIAKRILKNINSPFGIDGFVLNIAANIGVARYPENSISLRSVIKQSERALHVAKKKGRDQVKAFSPVMQDDLLATARFKWDFKVALKNKILTTYYQPLVDLKFNTITGFEALARWEHTPGKFIPPEQFIALAEETGTITELTEQLLRQACMDALDWPSHIMLSFNISSVQLSDKSLSFKIINILKDLNFPANRLEIEVTESALVQEANAARFTLKKLSDEGIKIAIDDFGTEYSSLSQLCNFSFDRLKIDKSFIDTFLHNDKQDKIVRAIISLAGALDVKITAEGIEHINQLNHLRILGCHTGQGYLLGKPMPQRDIQKISSLYSEGAFTLKIEK